MPLREPSFGAGREEFPVRPWRIPFRTESNKILVCVVQALILRTEKQGIPWCIPPCRTALPPTYFSMLSLPLHSSMPDAPLSGDLWWPQKRRQEGTRRQTRRP